jgi:hypothetical protein
MERHHDLTPSSLSYLQPETETELEPSPEATSERERYDDEVQRTVSRYLIRASTLSEHTSNSNKSLVSEDEA